jgi:hypothetical protein
MMILDRDEGAEDEKGEDEERRSTPSLSMSESKSHSMVKNFKNLLTVTHNFLRQIQLRTSLPV